MSNKMNNLLNILGFGIFREVVEPPPDSGS